MTDIPDAAIEAASNVLMPAAYCFCTLDSDTCSNCEDQARDALAAAMPAIRAMISDELISHRDYSQQFYPSPKFLVGLETAASVVRSGS